MKDVNCTHCPGPYQAKRKSMLIARGHLPPRIRAYICRKSVRNTGLVFAMRAMFVAPLLSSALDLADVSTDLASDCASGLWDSSRIRGRQRRD
jgi:hypothetical protein